MKTFAQIPALVVTSALVAATPASASTIYINFQDDNGETRMSMSCSSDLTGPGITADFTGWIGIGGIFPGSMTGVGGSPTNFPGLGSFIGFVAPMTGFGTFEDVTTGTTATMDTFVAAPNFLGAGNNLEDIRFAAGGLTNSIGDLIRYIPGTDSETVNIPFSLFNPGTYGASPQQFPGIDFFVTVEPIPEPSSVLIAALGLLGFVGFRWRRA